MIQLTPREFVVYTCILRWFAAHKQPPCLRDIADLSGIAIGGDTDRTVRALVNKGVLSRPGGCVGVKCRTLRLVRGLKVGTTP